MSRWESVTIALCAALVAGFILGRLSVASAAEEHEVTVYTLAKQADTYGVDPPTPTATATPTHTPTPAPTATPLPPTATATVFTQSAPAGCPAIIVSTFGANAPAACRVAWCESSYNPLATGAAGERGYFQVHPIHGYPGWTHDPVANTQYAYQLSNGGRDWSHWSCKP